MFDLIYFSHNEKSTVLLMFFVNTVVYSFLLCRSGQHDRKSSHWLAAFVLLGGLYICPFVFGYGGWYMKDGYREFLFYIPFQQLLLIGPVFYFYVRSLLNKNMSLSKKDFIHFFPAITYAIYSLLIFICDIFLFDEIFFYVDNKDKDLDFWYQVAGLISMLFYLAQSLKHYNRYRKAAMQEVSYADQVAYKWLNTFTVAFSLILILRVVFFILNPEWGEFGSKYWYYLSFSILLMYIAITGYSNTIRSSTAIGQFFLDDEANSAPPISVIKTQKTQTSKELATWFRKINLLFKEESIYKNPNLTLSDVASSLKTNRNIISKTINEALEMNFNDFVNEKRVEAVISNLNKGEHKRNTLLGIALDCGFNSKTTFNRAFKKYAGKTPKQYITENKL